MIAAKMIWYLYPGSAEIPVRKRAPARQIPASKPKPLLATIRVRKRGRSPTVRKGVRVTKDAPPAEENILGARTFLSASVRQHARFPASKLNRCEHSSCAKQSEVRPLGRASK
jgi:hypothetical protein